MQKYLGFNLHYFKIKTVFKKRINYTKEMIIHKKM